MTALATWKISTEPGSSHIEVNGEDVSGQVRRAALLVEVGAPQIPSLQLELTGGGTLVGQGIVKILPDDVIDEVGARQAVLAFLDAISPTELERRITAGPMNGGVGDAVLAVLKQMAVS